MNIKDMLNTPFRLKKGVKIDPFTRKTKLYIRQINDWGDICLSNQSLNRRGIVLSDDAERSSAWHSFDDIEPYTQPKVTEVRVEKCGCIYNECKCESSPAHNTSRKISKIEVNEEGYLLPDGRSYVGSVEQAIIDSLNQVIEALNNEEPNTPLLWDTCSECGERYNYTDGDELDICDKCAEKWGAW